ncbi:MAG TPA: ABC transporter permease [Gemmatimonadaceae bacterium]|nr:ABC transporter permease [Gemmatimonadaceae bacterium]
MTRLPNGIRRIFRLPPSRERLLREMDDEIHAHLDMRIDELRALGMSAADAEAEALRRFGSSDEYHAYAERRADMRARSHGLGEWLDEWAQDLRFAGRQFRRNPGFTALAVLTLALGIGANSAIFSVVHKLIIAPLPYADGNRIVRLTLWDGDRLAGYPPREALLAWRDRARSIETIAVVSIDALALQDFGDIQDTIPALVTSNYLALLGLHPAIGRGFTPDDEGPGAAPVAMISHGRWQREFGGSADILGKTIKAPEIDQRVYTIVGVMPPDIAIPMSFGVGVNSDLRAGAPGLWLPASLDSIPLYQVYAKLRPGVTAAVASAELQSLREQLPAPPPRPGLLRQPSELKVRAMRAQDFLDPREVRTVQVLFVAVAVLLLIACANVANLLMSRAWTRTREFAVRTAMGAGRARLARQMFTESVLLAFAGGVAGVVVAWTTLQIVLALRPATLEELAGVGIAMPVLFWSAGISLGTGILFGFAPALFAGGRAVGDILRRATHTASSDTGLRRLRSTLIAGEIALSLVLLVGAGLLVRSFAALQARPLNFEPKGLVSTNVILQFPRDWSIEARVARRTEMLERLRGIPGVDDATAGMMPGLGWLNYNREAETAEGQLIPLGESFTTFVTPDYIRITGMQVVEGRMLDPEASTAELREVVVNRSLADRLWGPGNVVGKHLREKGPIGVSQRQRVVGVVADIQLPSRRSVASIADIYEPMPDRFGMLPVVLRTSLSDAEITKAIRRAVAEYDVTLRAATRHPHGAIVQFVTIGDTFIREQLAPTRFAMALLLTFAVIALVLSAVGLYGVIAYSVVQRTREIGVRVALGADHRSVERLVVGAGLRLTAVGLVVGLLGAFASTRVLTSLLYGVSPVDPVSFVAIALLVAAIALLASYLPARRAVRIDPIAALRAE